MCHFSSDSKSLLPPASQTNAKSLTISTTTTSFDDSLILPVYETISPRLPPIYNDRREIEGQLAYTRVALTMESSTTLYSICFYESLIATVWNSGCLFYLIASIFPPQSLAFSNAVDSDLSSWIIALGVLILASNWISLLYGFRCIILGEEGLKGMRKVGIWIGTGISMIWMFGILFWFVAERPLWMQVDVGILLLCGQLGVLEQVYYEYRVKRSETQSENLEAGMDCIKAEYSPV